MESKEYLNSLPYFSFIPAYHNFKYLLEAVAFDKSLFKGPPYSVLPEDMEEFYGQWAKVELVEKYPIDLDGPWKKVPGNMPDDTLEVAYMITSRNG